MNLLPERPSAAGRLQRLGIKLVAAGEQSARVVAQEALGSFQTTLRVLRSHENWEHIVFTLNFTAVFTARSAVHC